MRIALINLRRAVERRERMAREFGTAGLSYEIKEAVDGRCLSESHLSQVDWGGGGGVSVFVHRTPSQSDAGCLTAK